jgi:hypothetical protein
MIFNIRIKVLTLTREKHEWITQEPYFSFGEEGFLTFKMKEVFLLSDDTNENVGQEVKKCH